MDECSDIKVNILWYNLEVYYGKIAFMKEELPNNESSIAETTIIIADDHPLLRQALRNVLERQPDFRIIAEASDGEEATRLALELCPNVVIMDIDMPKCNGLEAIRQIKARNQAITILVLTVHDDSEHILGILETGAAGYLTKSVFGEEVVHAIRSVVAGETVLSTEVSQKILRHALRYPSKPIPEVTHQLNDRELDVLRLAAKGMSNKSIAAALNLGLPTIKTYLSEVFAKLGANSRTEAAIIGLRSGILSIEEMK
jgi:NarL family two-component system response regulator LiaR